MHDGKYARLQSTAEVFETGMNAAVARLADAANGAGRAASASREPIQTFPDSPVTGKPVKLMAGRYGAYVTDGETNATLPKESDPAKLTAEEALVLLAERAAKGPAKGKKKPARKAPAKKAPAKNAVAKAKK